MTHTGWLFYSDIAWSRVPIFAIILLIAKKSKKYLKYNVIYFYLSVRYT